MSSLQKRAGNVIDPRLTAIANTTANLRTQMQELDGLRDRIRKARLSARRSRFPVVQRLGVNFQEVVHSALTEEAEVAEASDSEGEPNGRPQECASDAKRSRGHGAERD